MINHVIMMKLIKILTYGFLMIMFSRCIGTDVLAELAEGERIIIIERVDSLAVDESFTFQAVLVKQDGTEEITNAQWSSSAPSIIRIDPLGNATALMTGTATLTANYQQLQDSVIVHAGELTSAATLRTGQFSGLNNYSVDGNFVLERSEDELLLSFKDDFVTSNGPGLYVYLSASPNNVNGGLEVGPLQSSQGAQEYRIDNPITINTYDYVIIYCKPFGLAFGAGALN